VLTLEGVCEEGGEGFGTLDCFASVWRRLDWRDIVLRVLSNCRRCRSNSSCSRADSKGTLATEAPGSRSTSHEGHFGV
jgi:hypothetical protein